MSPWYHAACVLAGLVVDTNIVNPISYPYQCKDDYGNLLTCHKSVSAEDVLLNFRVCILSHVLMVFFALTTTAFNTKGRYNNKMSGKLEQPNAWLFMAIYLDMLASITYLLYSMYLQFIFQRVQLCMYDEKLQVIDNCFDDFS
jgi:hypothetical protein